MGGGNTKQVEEKLAELEEKIKQLESANEQTNQKVDSITKESLGLGNVDNTHDADKNVRTAEYLRVTKLLEGDNLNDCLILGAYTCYSSNEASTLLNSPTSSAFGMIVIRNAGYTQEITEYFTTKPKKWFRNMYDGAWGPWYRIYTEADPQPNLS